MNKQCKGKMPRAGLLALAIIGTAFSGAAFAESHGHKDGHKNGMAHHGMTYEQKKAHKAEKLAELRTALALTAEQEPAWQQYVTQMEQSRPAHPAGEKKDKASMTAPERLEHKLEKMTTYQGHLQGKLAALKTFYATLTPAQQATFDEKAKAWGGHKAKS